MLESGVFGWMQQKAQVCLSAFFAALVDCWLIPHDARVPCADFGLTLCRLACFLTFCVLVYTLPRPAHLY
jgi:hypothetical protein